MTTSDVRDDRTRRHRWSRRSRDRPAPPGRDPRPAVPDVDRAELDDRVHETYEHLKDEAAIDSQLVAMTEKQVTENLRRNGETVRVRSDESA
jgi:hypothetical protein